MKNLVLVAALLSPVVLAAQTVDYNKIILPDRISSVSFEEKLVQLAWSNHPSNRVAQQNLEIAKNQKKMAQWSWLDNISAVGNLNEFTLNPDQNERANFYPRYNFSVRITLGTLVQTPLAVKESEYNIKNADNLINLRKLQVREDVLVELERLKERFKFIRVREQVKEDYFNMYKAAEDQFLKGEITIERYRGAVQVYSLRTEEVIQAQSSYNQSKLAMEALIGVKLEEVEGFQELLAQLTEETKID